MKAKPLQVSEVNQYIKRIFAGDWLLSNIRVEGEISNFTHHYSGHMYFSLKDNKGRIKCIMFKSDNQKINFNIKDGLKVIVNGYVSVYEKDGAYQLYAKDIEQSGIGDLFAAFEKLKNKLDKEGMFSPADKKEIPYMPKKIGIVTSSTGAAIRDIINVIKRRFPITDILIYPALVQGEKAAKEISEGLIYLDNRDDIDLIITGRGGGSLEELFAFNDESMARIIHSMEKPLISAVGHETDFTIADFVADLRAPTPSSAAELATPELNKLNKSLDDMFIRLNKSFEYILNDNKIKLGYMKKSLEFYNPINQLKEKTQEQDNLFKNLIFLIETKIKNDKDKINDLHNRLNYLNPRTSLDRGYGIILDNENNIITSVKQLDIDKKLKLLIKDGMVKVNVVKINEGELNYGKD